MQITLSKFELESYAMGNHFTHFLKLYSKNAHENYGFVLEYFILGIQYNSHINVHYYVQGNVD